MIRDTVEIQGWCEPSEELLGIGCDSRDAYVDREVGLGPGGVLWRNAGWRGKVGEWR